MCIRDRAPTENFLGEGGSIRDDREELGVRRGAVAPISIESGAMLTGKRFNSLNVKVHFLRIFEG